MASADNFHSQLVGWSKIILPICGIGLLSTLFLFARSSTDDTGIPFAKIETLAREQRISAPQFSGVADDGSIIAIGAKSAQFDPTTPNSINALDLSLTLKASDGSEVRITAAEGEIDIDAKLARLRGLARLETSNGYTMETNGLVADLESGVITSDGALEIRAPFGTITAGRVTFETANDAKGQQMLFTQGVRLVYTPNGAESKDATE
ncbi:MAG: LPS export ABC transporter periplasmic protein LptC [Yoonia sp.]|nr:LPS export ABC transporter periplasmic protein LptC [Yoonia sp.]